MALAKWRITTKMRGCRFFREIIISVVVIATLVICGCSRETAEYIAEKYDISVEERTKVILDCDMTFLGDDAMCLSLLVQADSIGTYFGRRW